ncbi:YeiH family protein [Salinarimonas sp. NSM]|uniref:YeiH family protein n=1 Tax=Salinarimonas sp. NSM TaxID=3458003 RepID=UPI004037495E
MNAPSPPTSGSITGTARDLAPGILFATAIAVAATLAAPAVALVFPIPAMVLALLLGIALNRPAAAPVFQPGLTFCVKKLLRWAVALLGLRIALGDIVALGIGVALMVVASMALTILAGFALARALGQRAEYGALAGAATAVCGASAALATTTVLPNYKGKEADVAFVVVAVNALSTLAMIAYPPLGALLGFDHQTTGVLLGATIHDVAQVVGAGYAVSETAGNTAVVVKLFRVFLLLPVVLVIGWWFARAGGHAENAKVPAPVFAFVFLGLCLLNTAMAYAPALAPVYAPVRELAILASTWGLLIAIGALGLGTSLSAIARLGWRHIATVTGTTLVILALAAGALLVI